METREHGDDVTRDSDVDEVGEAAEDGAAQPLVNKRLDERRVTKPGQEFVDGRAELTSETGALLLVPTLSFQDVLLG